MDRKEEFKTEEEARKFLSTELIQPNRDGKYYYRERGIVVKNGYALILFQYYTSIIGYGVLEKPVPDVIYNEGIRYNGYLKFFTTSIHNIANITLSEIQRIDKRITHFSNPKWHIRKEYFNQIYDLLLQKQIDFTQSFD